MKRLVLIAFIISIILLTSCDNKLFSSDGSDEEHIQDIQLLFYSDVANIDREAVYYDALLDIKKEFPEEFQNMKVISEKNDNKKYEVDIYPSLLVIEKEEVVVQIEGAVLTKAEIIEPIVHALAQ
ncbi:MULTISPECIES: hypothetical protein [Metabacillus]|jgi:hypothetical protein|uniref:Small peptidoglycan-associated lipoprotein n=1 Tax=Metabacillus rhizolycopersici TaxID=2875709 RepID=A0ABS7ULG7_9BACI|nr:MULTISPECIES: hypothetical protein [Metabacillus]MBZ5748765.1 hypothetical protein [Metabacillus rhizolycopersici]MCM3652803.1 hypothetical protein [Metabacillus litoralis]